MSKETLIKKSQKWVNIFVKHSRNKIQPSRVTLQSYHFSAHAYSSDRVAKSEGRQVRTLLAHASRYTALSEKLPHMRGEPVQISCLQLCSSLSLLVDISLLGRAPRVSLLHSLLYLKKLLQSSLRAMSIIKTSEICRSSLLFGQRSIIS
jgi:hypothetical protein